MLELFKRWAELEPSACKPGDDRSFIVSERGDFSIFRPKEIDEKCYRKEFYYLASIIKSRCVDRLWRVKVENFYAEQPPTFWRCAILDGCIHASETGDTELEAVLKTYLQALEKLSAIQNRLEGKL
jgi:hypothetical protein